MQILKYLEQEQALLDSDSNHLPTQDHIALSAHSKPGPVVICSNCKHSGHIVTHCILPGGGMGGKTIEDSKQAWCRDRDALRKTNPSSLSVHSPKHKVTVNVKGTDGHVYYMLVDAEHLTSPSLTMPSDFAGIAATPLTVSPAPSSIPSSHLEEEEFVGWLATEEDPQTTIDWSACELPSSALAASASISTGQSYLSTSPFWLDTGASVHISPHSTDLSIASIPPRLVKGLGDSSVTTVGIGDIQLHVGTDVHVCLLNVLYIPEAAVQLISIRCLTRGSNAIIHFDNTTC